jgi:4a-hydroxytetrahydrobiopterin dehydratase
MTSSWKEVEGLLVKSLVFNDFNSAFMFMAEVAEKAEQLNHHPTWTNTYNRVEIKLCTHDAGNIVTEKDRELAQAIDRILQLYEVEVGN